MGGYAIERLRPELVREAATLRRATWGGTLDENVAYLDWKYLRNPYVPVPLLHMALHDGRAVAMRGLHGTCWEAGSGGARHVFPATSDSTILAEHRDAGLFTSLGKACIEAAGVAGHTHLVNPTSGENALTHVLTFGWRPTAPQGLMIRSVDAVPPSGRRHPSSVGTAVRARLQARMPRARRRANPFAGLDAAPPSPRGRPMIRVGISPPEDALEAVVARLPHDDRLLPVRDRELIAWRFDNPFLAYRFLAVETTDGSAYLVLSASPGNTTIMILDWVGNDLEAKRMLLEHVLPRSHDVHIWAGSLADADLSTLTEDGFEPHVPDGIRQRYAQRMLVRPVSRSETDADWELDGRRLDEPESWSLHALSSDIF